MTSDDEEDMAWGQQGQIALDGELSPGPPQGPGRNPKIDRRSATGSNFMRCLPEQATSLTSFACDRWTYLGRSAVLRHRQHRSKSGVQLCRAERQRGVGGGQRGGADVSQGSCIGSLLMGDAGGAGEDAGGVGGSAVGGGADDPSWTTSSSQSQAGACTASSSSRQTSGFFFSNKCSGEKAAGDHPGSMNSWMQIEPYTRMTHARQHSMTSGRSSGSCSTSCGYSHQSSSGRSCSGSCCMHGQAQRDCLGTVMPDRMSMHICFAQQQVSTLALPCRASLRRSSPYSAMLPSRLIQKRLRKGVRRVSECKLQSNGLARSCVQQSQLVPRLCV